MPDYEHKNKNLIYCRSQSMQGRRTLQDALSAALEARARASDRFQNEGVGDDEEQLVLFINNKVAWNGMLFGTLILYSPGRFQHVMGVDEQAEELNVTQLAPPVDDQGRRQEFLDSILHFGVLEDHVVLAQGRALRFQSLDRHLNWLLRETETLQQDDGLTLVRELAVDVRERARRTPIRRVSFGETLVTSAEEVDRPRQGRQRQVLRPRGKGMEVLRLLFEDDLFGEEEELSQFAGKDDLRVEISLSYKGRRNQDYDEALRAVVGAAQHVDEEDLHVEFESGRAHDGKLLIGERTNVRHVNGLIDPEDMWRKMHEQMSRWIDEGQI